MWSSPWKSIDKRMNEKEMGVGGEMGQQKIFYFYVFMRRMTRTVGGKNLGSRELFPELKQFKHDIG